MPKLANSTGNRRPQNGPTGSRALTDALYRCAKQDPQRRFHALYDKVGRPDMLARASLPLQTGPVARPLAGASLLRSDGGISPAAGSRATGDPGVSPDQTRTGWLS